MFGYAKDSYVFWISAIIRVLSLLQKYSYDRRSLPSRKTHFDDIKNIILIKSQITAEITKLSPFSNTKPRYVDNPKVKAVLLSFLNLYTVFLLEEFGKGFISDLLGFIHDGNNQITNYLKPF